MSEQDKDKQANPNPSQHNPQPNDTERQGGVSPNQPGKYHPSDKQDKK